MRDLIYIGKKQSIFTNIMYGKLYNWYVIDDVRGICPIGWHVPTKVEFETLVTYLGGYLIAGGKLKEIGLSHWGSPNTDATDEVGFNARGSGYRGTDGLFKKIKQQVDYWSITGQSTTDKFVFDLQYNYAYSQVIYSFGNRIVGSPVRLLKNSTTLVHGQTGTYTGNDGRVYRTICIGTQEWLADNLCETKYRDGSTIPEVTDSTIWSGLTTGARCWYNNDPLNE